MPLISSKGMYGLSAMHELYQHQKGEPMQIREISANANIPQNYLEQLLSKLRKAKLVKSIRGSRGGYMLATEPTNILVKDILIALEDGIKISDTRSQNPVLNIFLDETKQKVEKIFDLTLQDLEEYQDKYNQYLHYNI
ncbi:MAG: Rrf2 family transcriptional regulator [Candidatus Marinarcus sp.]|uniref:Rrf2 family transcriptional regulator n=1 Tax=Candidatus Marinarcus sp. TaxID=3100987 RepID=UPI003B0035C5